MRSAALNTAFVADGYFVDIAAGAALEAPIELQIIHAGGQTHVRLPVRVGAGAKATIVERQTGDGRCACQLDQHISRVGDGAELTWLIVQEQPDDGDPSRPVQRLARQGREAHASSS